MLIRPYNKADFLECMTAFETNVPKFFTVAEVTLFKKFLETFATPTKFYVVELDTKIIGAGGFGKRLDNNDMTLIWGYIDKNFHRKGYGKALLNHRLKIFREAFPTEPMRMDTTQHSFPFYEKHGFKLLKITPNYYTENLHRYDLELGN